MIMRDAHAEGNLLKRNSPKAISIKLRETRAIWRSTEAHFNRLYVERNLVKPQPDPSGGAREDPDTVSGPSCVTYRFA